MKKIIFIIMVILIGLESKSQINIDDQISRRVKSKSQFRVKTYRTVISVLGTEVKEAKFQRIKKIEYKVTSGDVSMQTNRVTYLPEQVIVNYYSNKNCSDSKRGWTQELTLKVTEGQTVKFSTTTTSGNDLTNNWGIKIPVIFKHIAPEISYSGTYATTYRSNETNENEQSNTKEETISRSMNFEVDTNKALFVKFQTTKYGLRVPFIAKLIVEGEVIIENITSHRIGNHTDNKITGESIVSLRSLLSKDERTFNISGFIENSKAGMEEVEFAEISLPPDSCEAYIVEPLIAIMEKLSTNKKLTKEETEKLNSNQFAEAIKASAKKIRFKKVAK